MIGKIDLWGIFSDIKKEFNWELTAMQKNLVMEIMIRSEKMEKEQKLSPSLSSAEEEGKIAELKIRNIVHSIVNGSTHPLTAATDLIKIIVPFIYESTSKSSAEEAIGFAEWCEENYCRHMSGNWMENKNAMNVAIKNSDLFSTSELYNLYKNGRI